MVKCPKCKKRRAGKIFKTATEFNIIGFNTQYIIYKCKYCNHKWLSEHTPSLSDLDMSDTKNYENVPQWFYKNLKTK